MLARRSAAHRHRSGRLAARLILCALLFIGGMGGPPSPAESAEPPATLSTGVIPTMGINDATEGADAIAAYKKFLRGEALKE